MFIAKDFSRRCCVAQICANSGVHAHFGAYLRDEAMPTNFELKRLELKLNIVEKPECMD